MSRVYYTNSGSGGEREGLQDDPPDRAQAPWRQASTRSSTASATITARRSPTLSAGGQPERNAQYGPLAPGFVMVPHCLEYRAQWDAESYGFGCATRSRRSSCARVRTRSADSASNRSPRAAASSRRPRATGTASRRSAAKYDILLHIDEVVCGVGRTGSMVRLPALRHQARLRDHGQGRGLRLCGDFLHR
jgi:taurine-pyruvate aminotransferase